MLLQQSTNFLPGRHQRQHSTPTVFDHPNATNHRRGLSSDQPGYAFRQNGGQPSNHSIHNFEYPLGQQLTPTATMRVTQQHPVARPGLNQQQMYQQYNHNQASKEEPRLAHGTEAFNNNYFTTPKPEFNDSIQHSLQQQTYNMNTMDSYQLFDSTTSAGCLDGFGNGLDGHLGNVQPNEIMNTSSMPQGASATAGSRPTSRGRLQQPCTPPSQTRMTYFPMTPATTPFSNNANLTTYPYSRTTESSPCRRDPNQTIKAPQAMQRGSSYQDNFAMMRQHSIGPDMPSPPNSIAFEPRKSVDFADFPQPNFFNMSELKMDIPLWNDGYNASNYSPMSNAVSSSISSFQSSPEVTHMPLFEPLDAGTGGSPMTPNMSRQSSSQSATDDGSQNATDAGSNASPAHEDPQPRSQSMSQIDDITECFEETGITCDDIAAFISGPNASNKWDCLYPNCSRNFNRRENIKAHVQTHLGDRQYRCQDCNKRFVRQHDLKRHANIHSGEKKHLCGCGQSFARTDAWTRHRIRKCCTAFPNAVKKNVKRGRPKKPRPNAGERVEKSAATRQRVLEKAAARQYESSISNASTSAYSSPEQYGSPFEPVSSPPELDISSSSPAAPKLSDFDVTFSEPLTALLVPPQSNADFFNQDFDLSASLMKDDSSKEADESTFNEYLSQELDRALHGDDFVYDTQF